MTRRLILELSVAAFMDQVPPALFAEIDRQFGALVKDPEPIGSRPFGGIENAMELRTGKYTILYTYGDDHLSVWVVRINT